MLRSILGVALALMISTSIAAAQQSATAIAGTVKDTTGSVMPGVTVEASSPVLIEKVRTTVTDEQGQYRIVNLRPGTYTVTFALVGFATLKRDEIELNEGFTAPVNAELRVGGIEETVVVSGASPVVDVQSTVQSTVMTREALTTIPTGEFFGMLANLMPGVTGSSASGQQDVGGNSGFGSIRMSIHGGLGTDQQVFIDGFTIMRSGGDGTTNVVPIEGSVQEYNMEVSGHPAEAETGGIRVSIVPRSGGNNYSGGAYWNFTNSSLQGSNLSPYLQQALNLMSTSSVKQITGFSPSFGGPLKQDKLWFYTSFGRNITDNYVASDWENVNVNAWTYVADLSRPAVNDVHSQGGNGRLSYQINNKHRLTAYFEHNNLHNYHLGLTGTSAPEAATRANLFTYTYQLNWTAPLTSKLLLQAGWGRIESNPYDFGNQLVQSDHAITDSGFSYSAGASRNIYLARIDHYKSSLSYITGSHSFKAGLEIQNACQCNMVTTPNHNQRFALVNGKTSTVMYSTGPIRQTQNVRPNLGLYVQDRWTMKKVTADVGLRLDWLRTSYPDETLDAAQYRPSAVTFPGATVLNWKDLNPRLGVAYDLFGNGRTALVGNLSRYVKQETTAITAAQNPASATQGTTTRSWTDNGDFIVQGDPLNPLTNLELGPGSNKTFGQPNAITTRLDPRFQRGFDVRPYQWELSGGVRQQLLPGMALNVTYYRRSYGNAQITQNAAVSPSNFSPYCVTAPADQRLPGGGGYQLCGLYDLNQSGVGLVDNVLTSASFFGDQIQRYNGLDVLVSTRLKGGVILQGGLNTGSTLTDNCDVVKTIGNSTGNPGPLFCRTETPFLNSFRMNGAYPLPWDSQISAAFQSNPGPNITAAGTFSNAQIMPSLLRNLSSGTSATVALVEPGTLYNVRANQLDLRFIKNLKVRQSRWQASIDLANALNASPILNQNNTYGTNGATWQKPTLSLSPRLFKFGIRMDF